MTARRVDILSVSNELSKPLHTVEREHEPNGRTITEACLASVPFERSSRHVSNPFGNFLGSPPEPLPYCAGKNARSVGATAGCPS